MKHLYSVYVNGLEHLAMMTVAQANKMRSLLKPKTTYPAGRRYRERDRDVTRLRLTDFSKLVDHVENS